MIDSIASLTANAAPGLTQGAAPGKTHGAAQQFEALLIGQLLKSAREAGGSGWLGAGESDDAGEIGVEVAEQEFARMLASNGGLGMARMIEDGLQTQAAGQESSSPVPSTQAGPQS